MFYHVLCVVPCYIYVFYSKFYWSVLYIVFDPIIFVQVTRFCLLSYSFMYCILYFLFYFSCFICFFFRFVSWSWHDYDQRHNYCRDNVHCHSHDKCHIINSNLILHKFCFRFFSKVCSMQTLVQYISFLLFYSVSYLFYFYSALHTI